MTIKEFIKDEHFMLPRFQSEKEGFKRFIYKELDLFVSKLEGLVDNEYFDDFKDYSISSILARQIKLVEKVKEAINHSYDGKPSNAYQSVEEGLQGNSKDYYRILNVRKYESGENFYRLRIHKENYPLSIESFFHIPFNLRGRVKTQRFSIPGFPSLYLGNSVYVCWEELQRPNINDFQAVRIILRKALNIIDLSPPKADSEVYEIYKYLMIWPLVLTSSVKVRVYDDAFKPEYIIPQLLLQWVREKEEIDGIAYQITHIDYSGSLSKGRFINFVLPVKENKSRGLCNVLKSKFEMTNPISYQLSQCSVGEGNFIYSEKELLSLNHNIEKIEFIKGRAFPYGHSVLGSLERTLNYMKSEILK